MEPGRPDWPAERASPPPETNWALETGDSELTTAVSQSTARVARYNHSGWNAFRVVRTGW